MMVINSNMSLEFPIKQDKWKTVQWAYFFKTYCILGCIMNYLLNKSSRTSKYNILEAGPVQYGYHGKYSDE